MKCIEVSLEFMAAFNPWGFADSQIMAPKPNRKWQPWALGRLTSLGRKKIGVQSYQDSHDLKEKNLMEKKTTETWTQIFGVGGGVENFLPNVYSKIVHEGGSAVKNHAKKLLLRGQTVSKDLAISYTQS